MTRTSATNDFIKKSEEYHKYKYDYKLVNYINSRTKIKIICPIHGEFEQTPKGHLNGGCKLCGNIQMQCKNLKTNTDFTNKAMIKHNKKYDYTIIDYNGAHKKIKIICPIHGEFEQTPNNHLKGHGCPHCTYNLSNTETFITRAKLIHNDKYDYSKVIYIHNKSTVIIICKLHGEFKQTPDKHLNTGQGCPNCKESKGEKEVKKILSENKILYISQYKFNNCKNKLKLPFDFYLPEHNICIEYHGEQHYKPINFFGGVKSFKQQQKRDKIKEDYCLNNNIKLIKVKYTQRNINRFLSRHLFKS